MAKKKVILTIPHGCIPEAPLCDTNADLIALKTGTILAEKCPECKTSIHVNKFPRTTLDLDCMDKIPSWKWEECMLDMNRPQTRGMEFRKAIDEEVKKHDVLLLDTHTYPADFSKWKKYDVVVFDLPKRRDNTLAQLVTEEFQKRGIKTKRIDVESKRNDIAQQVNDKGDDAILIEFNQKLDVEEIAEVYAEVIQEILKREDILH